MTHYPIPTHHPPTTARVHEIARPLGLQSATVIWLLRLIGIPVKSSSSKVTLSDIEGMVLLDMLALHQHEPMVSTIVPVSHGVLFAKCVCTVPLASLGEGRPWKLRRHANRLTDP